MPHPPPDQSVRPAPLAAGVAVGVLGVVVLAGWALDVEGLKSFGPGLVSMKANTALGLVFLGGSLALLAQMGRTEGAGRALGGLVAALAIATLGQYVTGLDFGIDQLLFEESAEAIATVTPGRMALNTALGFLAAGLALLLVGRGRHRTGELLAAVTALVGFQGLVGYALDVDILYGLPNATAMAVHTAGAFLVLAVGILLLRPERGWMAVVVDRGAAGVTVRRLIPVALLGPLAIGWIAAWMAGSRGVDERFALSVVVTLVTVLVVVAVGVTAFRVRALDRERTELLEGERRLRAELEDALARAEEANEAKSAFLATISHELRTPLSAIIGYTELLREGVGGPLADSHRRPVERVGYSARHLKQLIDELLAFSRLEAGQEKVRIEEVQVADLVVEIEAVIEPLAEERQLDFRIETDHAPRTLRADPSKLRQILLNLLGNAVKFTPAGHVRLSVRGEEGAVLFEVADTGIGIREADRERLFEPFWRADASNTGSDGGTGLGLTISRRYAELLGGELDVESAPGEGSRFRLRLPTHPGPA